jgi:hypothetical protein
MGTSLAVLLATIFFSEHEEIQIFPILKELGIIYFKHFKVARILYFLFSLAASKLQGESNTVCSVS